MSGQPVKVILGDPESRVEECDGRGHRDDDTINGVAIGRGIALNTLLYSSGFSWLPCRSLEDTVDSAARLGYDAVEIAACAPHAYPAYLDSARRRAVGKLGRRRWSRDQRHL